MKAFDGTVCLGGERGYYLDRTTILKGFNSHSIFILQKKPQVTSTRIPIYNPFSRLPSCKISCANTKTRSRATSAWRTGVTWRFFVDTARALNAHAHWRFAQCVVRQSYGKLRSTVDVIVTSQVRMWC